MVALKLGIIPAIAGVSITLLVVPIQGTLVRFVSKTRRETAKWTDERVRLTSELIQVIHQTLSIFPCALSHCIAPRAL